MLKKFLFIFIMSMVPIIELRGAIPFAVGFNIPLWQAYVTCIIGNMVPVPIIFLFARKVLEWGQDKPVIGGIFTWILQKGRRGGKKLLSKTGRSAYIGLLLFVGIPLPGTGAWTGTLAASILDLDFKKSVLAALGGVLLAGIIMAVASTGVFSFIRAF